MYQKTMIYEWFVYLSSKSMILCKFIIFFIHSFDQYSEYIYVYVFLFDEICDSALSVYSAFRHINK